MNLDELQLILASSLGLIAVIVAYVTTLAAAYARGAKNREDDLIEEAIENPLAFERWRAERMLERLDHRRERLEGTEIFSPDYEN